MTRRRARAAAAVVLAAGVLLASAAPAASAADGFWYVDVLDLDAAQADGATGEGVTVAVIDGQINTAIPTLAGADITVHEPSFCFSESGEPVPAETTALSPTDPTEHGTNVVAMLVGTGEGYAGQTSLTGIAPDAKILYYASYSTAIDDSVACLNERGGASIDSQAQALTEALDAGADIVSMSFTGGASPDFVSALARAFREGVPVVAGLKNSAEFRILGDMPANANGAIGVQAAGADGGIQQTDGVDNVDAKTDVVAPGLGITIQGNAATGSWEEQSTADGTSLGTPLVAGALALVKQKYPAATGNQLIQSLIRNTAGEPDHEPDYDPAQIYGYGLISIDNLLSVDPTEYPDTNPLIRETPDAGDVLVPTYAEIFDSAGESPEPTAEAQPENETSAPGIGLIVGIVVGGLVVIGLIILVVIIVVRRSRSTGTSSQQGRQP